MRNLLSIFVFVAVALFVSSCNFSPEKMLPRKDGKWTFSRVYQTTIGTTSDKQNTSGTATFSENGTGSMKESTASSATEFDWSYNDNTKIMTYATTNLTLNSTYKFTVSESKYSAETWTRKDTVLGIIIEETYTWVKAKN